ncbi:MAG: leucine-rich repeat domain-containing protein [Prevotella sp.]|nr:leucine-rich repeat domain-containing protein [Prevotella sp.]
MKKITFRGLLAALLLFCSAPAWAFTTGQQNYDFEVDGIYYHILSTDGQPTAEVTFLYYDMQTNANNQNKDAYTGDIVIPETVWDIYTANHPSGGSATNKLYTITGIGDYAFYYNTSLTSVEIPNTVTSIGYQAFICCSALKTVILGNSVQSIDIDAFFSCSALTQIVSLNTTPPVFTADTPPAFSGGLGATLFVPYGSKSAYTEDTANSGNSYSTWNPSASHSPISKIKEFLEVEITAQAQSGKAYGCATFYSDNPFYTYYSYPLANPINSYIELKCSTASVSEGELTLNWEYGNTNTKMLPEVVPGKTAVVIYGLLGTHYPVIYDEDDDEGVSAPGDAPEDNMLLGSEEATETTGPNGETEGYKFYKFTYEDIVSGVYTGLGFYWDQDNGAAFESAAFKAWLAVPDNTADAKISSFVLGEDNTTGIRSVDSSKPESDAIYNLQGIRVNDMSRPGIYIVGGKKVIKK